MMPPQLESIPTTRHVHDLRIRGEVDVCVAPTLKARLLEKSDASIRLDIRDLTFIDCRAISVLLEVRETLRQNGHDMVITGAQSHIARVFRILELESLLVA